MPNVASFSERVCHEIFVPSQKTPSPKSWTPIWSRNPWIIWVPDPRSKYFSDQRRLGMRHNTSHIPRAVTIESRSWKKLDNELPQCSHTHELVTSCPTSSVQRSWQSLIRGSTVSPFTWVHCVDYVSLIIYTFWLVLQSLLINIGIPKPQNAPVFLTQSCSDGQKRKEQSILRQPSWELISSLPKTSTKTYKTNTKSTIFSKLTITLIFYEHQHMHEIWISISEVL